MNLRTLFWLSVITGCLMAPIVQGQSVTLDGFYDANNDHYENSDTVGWVNGHELKKGNSDYGDGSGDANTWDQTTIRYGDATLAGDQNETQYFFLYIEVPIYAKTMEWDDSGNAATTIANFWKYDLGGKNLHGEESKVNSLTFDNATGSEKLEFLASDIALGEYVESKGKLERTVDYSVAFTADLDGSVSSQWGLVDSKDSVAYILETTKGTKDSSFNPDIPMAFEFMFDKADANFDKQAILDSLDRGVVFHLSPEMIIPEPSSALLLSVASIGMLLRRKR